MKISIQTGDIVDVLGFEKGYAEIRRAGFEAIDWNLDHAWKKSFRTGDYRGYCNFEESLDKVIEMYSEELEIIRKNGLTITQAHAPFPSYTPDCPEIFDYAIENYKRNIEFCDYAGCKNLVIHGISYTFQDKINTPETIKELNHKLYTSLIPTLLKTDVTVCLENLFSGNNGVCYQGHCSYPDDAVAEIDGLNFLAGKEVFGFCLDTGHANLLHHDLRVFIPKIGNRLKCLHIHDNNGSSDQHLAPMTGTVDWNRFCSALKEIGYDLDLSFETFHQTNIAYELGEEAMFAWIKLIFETGNIFRKKITE